MSRLTDLLRQVRQADTQLAKDLEAEISQLTNRRTFGLVFEPHQPEAVELPGRTIRRGDKVRLLPPRGKTSIKDQRLWRVAHIDRADTQRLAHLTELDAATPDTLTHPVKDLVVAAEFSDRIYPGLVETGRIERGGDKPFHTVINAENYHALQLLTYTHRHSIDAIYIDPPYNTGAKDWKYNNNYVEGDDDYRHSKWLAFMERRLHIARDLLNPDDSVLIVTIDEKEYLRLGLLLEQTFPEARIQMISTVINPKGASRSSAFGRVDEYIFVVMFGDMAPVPLQLGEEWKIIQDPRANTLRWAELLRSGSGALRRNSPGNFYPIFIKNTNEGPVFHSVGSTYTGTDINEVEPPTSTVAIWPIRSDGSEGRWQVGPTLLRQLIEAGYARIGKWRGAETSLSYLNRGAWQKVESGQFEIIGRRADNSIIVDGSNYKPSFIPGTQWRIESHNAEQAGTNLIKTLLPGRRFPFPKSLYAVEDALRFFVKDKSKAKILDFFAGSGTTAHAVMRLNKQDGGRRQSISVTNNEVSAEEQRTLRKAGLRPGDPDWEALGICDYITKPRITAAITGHTPDGEPIKGDYRFTDEFPMADGFKENAAYFTLTYETPLAVRHHRAFERIAPMLWLRAGAHGRIITTLGDQGWDIAQAYAVLANFDQTEAFLTAIRHHPGCLTVYIITDDDTAFQMICRELPEHLRPVQLYESYLHNFTINQGQPH
ncbi:hypothetical protein GCM10023190_17840 [Enteractinococcus fodinae]|uniref:Adenine-specific DNA-methyltransferase n=1 Tax=Enteractinococcus fodinae TaxID=684663 RepID=A0ABU2B043_9MICC|nr:site-specific DNA-methyltransferase [Enteractinococcus fodinae]MDR7345744.1 adenine-specific DNA-methyltransferase [Enteractinococcus fodinae]